MLAANNREVITWQQSSELDNMGSPAVSENDGSVIYELNGNIHRTGSSLCEALHGSRVVSNRHDMTLVDRDPFVWILQRKLFVMANHPVAIAHVLFARSRQLDFGFQRFRSIWLRHCSR